jgi:hypothetical protein
VIGGKKYFEKMSLTEARLQKPSGENFGKTPSMDPDAQYSQNYYCVF